MRSSQKKGFPRQVATLVRHTEQAFQAIEDGERRSFIPTWKISVEPDIKARKKQWMEIILSHIAQSHGQDISNLVKIELGKSL